MCREESVGAWCVGMSKNKKLFSFEIYFRVYLKNFLCKRGVFYRVTFFT